MPQLKIRTKEYWKEYARKYYLKNKERMDAHSKLWAKNNKERVNKKTRERRKNNFLSHKAIELKRRFGLDFSEYERMLIRRNGLCDICRKINVRANRKYGTLVVDHCHDTLKIRGLLCDSCNLALGLLKHDIKIIEAAVNYLQNHEQI